MSYSCLRNEDDIAVFQLPGSTNSTKTSTDASTTSLAYTSEQATWARHCATLTFPSSAQQRWGTNWLKESLWFWREKCVQLRLYLM